MFMILKKKQLIMTTLVLMFGIAGYLNYRYDKKPDYDNAAQSAVMSEPGIGETVMVNTEAQPQKPTEETDFFAVRRLERDKARAKTCEELKKTLESSDISEEMRAQTEESLSKLLHYEETEINAQNLLSAKGFEETLVYITDDGITVTIRQTGISRSDTAKIVDVIYELTENNNIKIVEVN